MLNAGSAADVCESNRTALPGMRTVVSALSWDRDAKTSTDGARRAGGEGGAVQRTAALELMGVHWPVTMSASGTRSRSRHDAGAGVVDAGQVHVAHPVEAAQSTSGMDVTPKRSSSGGSARTMRAPFTSPEGRPGRFLRNASRCAGKSAGTPERSFDGYVSPVCCKAWRGGRVCGAVIGACRGGRALLARAGHCRRAS